MKQLLIYLSALVILLLTNSCLQQIDLSVDRAFQDNVVVQGSLVIGSPSLATVRVSKLFDFTSNGRGAINVRFVRLYDSDGNFVELEPGDEVGDYTLEIAADNPDFPVETGKSYHIELATFDGRAYETIPDRLYPVPEASRLDAREITVEVQNSVGEIFREPRLEFSVTTSTDNGIEDPAFLRWSKERTFLTTDEGAEASWNRPAVDPKTCYVTESTNVNNLPSARSLDFAGDITEFPILQEPIAARFAEGYYISVFQQSLSPGAYEYWLRIADLINREGTIFESPVGKVNSNVVNTNDPNDEPFGYFYVTQQDTMRMFISPEFVGNPPLRCPVVFENPPPGFDYCETVPLCCDCFSARRSQLERPDFWLE
ncbi:MAG: DUF4249 family protein [Saprospiraceae bacterium]|nr:DUF4249 family protein [Saprospiraceae bacterium]